MRYRRGFLYLLAAQAVAFASSAPAAAQEGVDDARCYILSTLFARSGEEKLRGPAARAAFFYLGRLSGSTAEVEARLAAQAATITSENTGPLMTVCHQAMARRANEIQAVVNRLAQTRSR